MSQTAPIESDVSGIFEAVTSLSIREAIDILNKYGHRQTQCWYPEMVGEKVAIIRGDDQYEWLTVFEVLVIAESYLHLSEMLGGDINLCASVQFGDYPLDHSIDQQKARR